MADTHGITQGMQVLGSDGGMVGRVLGLHGDHVHVEPDAPEPGAADHVVPLKWVARVDEHVHLDREARLVRDTWRTSDGRSALGAADADGGKDRGWIVWLIGAIMLLIVIVLGVRGCVYAASDSDMSQPNVDAPDS